MRTPLRLCALTAAFLLALEAAAFSEGFESPALAGSPMPLSSWSGFSPVVGQYGTAEVQDTRATSGSQALQVYPDSAVAWSPDSLFAPVGQRLVTTLQLYFDSFASEVPVTPTEALSAVLYVNDQGLMALDGDGAGGGSWQVLQGLALGTSYELTVTKDYGAQTYAVSLDGSLLAQGLGFKDAIAEGPFTASFESSETVYIDQVSAEFVDEQPPSLSSLSPAPLQASVGVDTALVLIFDEPIQKGAGSFRLKEALGHTLVESIDPASDAVTIDGSVVRVVPASELASSTRYYFEVDAGSLLDLSGNPYTGLQGVDGWSFTTGVAVIPSPSLIAHYRFDVEESGRTPDALGSHSADLGASVSISQVTARAGAGSLFMDGSDSSSGSPADGAQTSNHFAWSSAARTLTFWWKSAGETAQGTFVSHGVDAAGERLDIKDSSGLSNGLRVEIGGAGSNSQPANFDNGNWHFVAVVVPSGASFSDIAWYVDGSQIDLNTSSNNNSVLTGTGPLVFGDSIAGAASADRVPHGYLDEFQLYDRVLTQEELTFLYSHPGSVIGTAVDQYTDYISNPVYGLDASEQGAELDPDGDGLKNALEAWLGTQPNVPDYGIVDFLSDGQTSSFAHPSNPQAPADLIADCEWSPDLTHWYFCDGIDGPGGGQTASLSLSEADSRTTVSVVSGVAMEKLFLRRGVSQFP